MTALAPVVPELVAAHGKPVRSQRAAPKDSSAKHDNVVVERMSTPPVAVDHNNRTLTFHRSVGGWHAVVQQRVQPYVTVDCVRTASAHALQQAPRFIHPSHRTTTTASSTTTTSTPATITTTVATTTTVTTAASRRFCYGATCYSRRCKPITNAAPSPLNEVSWNHQTTDEPSASTLLAGDWA